MNVYLLSIVKGILYGMFSVIPGLSGGALASFFGDYQRCIQILSNKDFNIKSIIYMISLFIGIILGMCVSSYFVLFIYYKFRACFMFLVLTMNTFMILKFLKKIKIDIHLLFIVILGIIIVYISRFIYSFNFDIGSIPLYLICSLIYSLSKVLPGISSTSILINIGFYDNILQFYSNPISEIINKPILWILFWITFMIISLKLIKIVNKMINSSSFDYFIFIVMIINTILLLI